MVDKCNSSRTGVGPETHLGPVLEEPVDVDKDGEKEDGHWGEAWGVVAELEVRPEQEKLTSNMSLANITKCDIMAPFMLF